MTTAKTTDEAIMEFYRSATEEKLLHISLRDRAISVYIGLIVALIAAGASREFGYAPFLAIPFTAYGFTLIANQHNRLIGELARYCVIELNGALLARGITAKCWDGSESVLPGYMNSLSGRFDAQLALMIAPSIGAVGLTMLALSESYRATSTVIEPAIMVLLVIAVGLIYASWRDIRTTTKIRTDAMRDIQDWVADNFRPVSKTA